ncbi:uncharacterized protein LOC106447791 [Brassica napus]|uniref:uncharacterized protein LOC106447791 n=1 Tax=Brassica napus TaxID=3708 RepID=UPI0006AAF1FF|nr:uncharacterized protein LOC106447791 [Brassica napus]
MFDGIGDPDDHIAQYKERMLAVALPKESREATMCRGFGSTLIGHALQWYINLPTRSISSFAGLSDKFVEQFASNRSLEKTSDGLYEILQHRVEPLRDYIARFNQEKVGGPRMQHPYCDLCLQKRYTSRQGAIQRVDHVPLQDHGRCVVPSLGAVSTPELVNALRHSGIRNYGVTSTAIMKAPDSFRNPELWCDFHRDHGHKTEDCIALWIEVNELLQKGYLREFLSEKAKAHLSKETAGNSKGAAPTSPPRQDRVIIVISGGSEVSGVSLAAAKKSTHNAKRGLEMTQPKRQLLGTGEISFTAKEQEKILAPHHDALVISLT